MTAYRPSLLLVLIALSTPLSAAESLFFYGTWKKSAESAIECRRYSKHPVVFENCLAFAEEEAKLTFTFSPTLLTLQNDGIVEQTGYQVISSTHDEAVIRFSETATQETLKLVENRLCISADDSSGMTCYDRVSP